MKYCKQCGTQLEETASFCASCGAKQEEAIRTEIVEQPKTKQELGLKWGLMIVAIFSVIIVSGILSLTLFRAPEPNVQNTAKAIIEEKSDEYVIEVKEEIEEKSEEEKTEEIQEKTDESQSVLSTEQTAFVEKKTNLEFSKCFESKEARNELLKLFTKSIGTNTYTYFDDEYVWILKNGNKGVHSLEQFKSYGYIEALNSEDRKYYLYHFVESEEGVNYVIGHKENTSIYSAGYMTNKWEFDVEQGLFIEQESIGSYLIVYSTIKVNASRIYGEQWSADAIMESYMNADVFKIIDGEKIGEPEKVSVGCYFELIDNEGNLEASIWQIIDRITNSRFGTVGFLYQTYDDAGFVTGAYRFGLDEVDNFYNGTLSSDDIYAIAAEESALSAKIMSTEGIVPVHWDSCKGQLWQGLYNEEALISTPLKGTRKKNIFDYVTDSFLPMENKWDYDKADIRCINCWGEEVYIEGIDISDRLKESSIRWCFKINAEEASLLSGKKCIGTDNEIWVYRREDGTKTYIDRIDFGYDAPIVIGEDMHCEITEMLIYKGAKQKADVDVANAMNISDVYLSGYEPGDFMKANVKLTNIMGEYVELSDIDISYRNKNIPSPTDIYWYFRISDEVATILFGEECQSDIRADRYNEIEVIIDKGSCKARRINLVARTVKSGSYMLEIEEMSVYDVVKLE